MNLRIIITITLASLFLTSSIYGFDDLSHQSNEVSNEILPLRLLGTIVEAEAGESIAVIKDIQSQKQYSLKISHNILDYQIVKIARGRVVLLRMGRLYSLEFPLGSELLEPITIVSSDTRIIHRDCLAEKISDLNLAMQMAMPIPHIVSGKIAGFKITKIKDKALAQMAGLRDGDIVTGINGEKINSIKSVLDLYSRAKSREKINLEIKRDNEIKNLTYYIN